MLPLTSTAATLELEQGGRLAGRDREALGGASGSARIKCELQNERGAVFRMAEPWYTAAAGSCRVPGHTPAPAVIGKLARARHTLCTPESFVESSVRLRAAAILRGSTQNHGFLPACATLPFALECTCKLSTRDLGTPSAA